MRVGVHVHRIVAHLTHRRLAFEHREFAVCRRCLAHTAHSLHVAHRASEHVLRHFETESVPRLQQHAFTGVAGDHEPHAHRAIRGLAEIAAFGMLQVPSPADQRVSHIGERRAHQHAEMLLFAQMLHNGALPVTVEHIFTHGGREFNARAACQRLDQHMHLGIVTQRFEMPRALHRRAYRLLVQDRPLPERHFKTEPRAHQLLHNLQLHGILLSADLNGRLLVFQLAQRDQAGVRVAIPGEQRIGEHWLQYQCARRFRRTEPLAGHRAPKSGDRAHLAGGHAFHRRRFRTGVHANLIDFLTGFEHHLRTQLAAGHLEPRESVARCIVGDLEHLRAEILTVRRLLCVGLESAHELGHALHTQGRSEIHREHAAACDETGYRGNVDVSRSHILVHRGIILQRNRLQRRRVELTGGIGGEVGTGIREPALQLCEHGLPTRLRHIHFVDEYERGHVILPEQAPQRLRVTLDAIRRAHHEHRIVEHP